MVVGLFTSSSIDNVFLFVTIKLFLNDFGWDSTMAGNQYGHHSASLFFVYNISTTIRISINLWSVIAYEKSVHCNALVFYILQFTYLVV